MYRNLWEKALRTQYEIYNYNLLYGGIMFGFWCKNAFRIGDRQT